MDPFGRPRSALVLGGASEIALRIVGELAEQGLDRVVLAVRDPVAAAPRVAAAGLGLQPTLVTWDAIDDDGHGDLLAVAADVLGEIDLVLCAVGELGSGTGIHTPSTQLSALLASNFTGPAVAVAVAAEHLVGQGHGLLVVLSSVAAVRPRRLNYPYAAAKAGLDAFARGLADALQGTGVRVLVVRPGFVATRMTEGLVPAPGATTTDAVASAVVDALDRPGVTVLSVPAALGPMFGLLRLLPDRLWRRLTWNR